jgi:nucleoside-diphosphate-sugar epimerase
MSRIFLAGAAGAIGRRLTPLLIAHGHTVWGATRSPDKGEFLRKLGTCPVLVDVFDAEGLTAVVIEAKPEIVIHQLTDLAAVLDPARRSTALARNARIRDEGTRDLVAVARKAGAHRLIAQSIAWAYAPRPRPWSEDAPLDLNAEGDRRVSVRGVESLERQALAASPMEGVVPRYGRLYGPGSGTDAPPSPPSLHVDAAAYAALLAIDHGDSGVFNVADSNDELSTDKAVRALGWRADFRLKAA